MNLQPQDYRSRARTKIVATVGPACSEENQLAELVAAGVDVFRLNMAHLDEDRATQTLEAIRRVGRRLDQPIAVLVDLAGPKIRLGELAGGSIECLTGARFDFIRGETFGGPHVLTSTYPALVDELSVGDLLMLADGTVSMVVEEKLHDRLRTRVVQPGTIRSRQGINLPGIKLSVPSMSEDDRRHASWAARSEIDFVGLSFVRAAGDVEELKALLGSLGSAAHVIAKIEKREALDALEQIVQAADGVMVARGDLGVEIDVAEMPMEQKRIIATAARYQRPVIIATQMLESMHQSPRPTRAETTDVANAILDGGDACMLSGETAIGAYPRAAVEMMNRIALATEARMENRPPDPVVQLRIPGLHDITQAVVYGAGRIAHQLNARLIVVATHSGATALALAKQRGKVPAIGISDKPATLRKMCLYWGVFPVPSIALADVATLIESTEAWARDAVCIEPGDRIVILAGSNLTRDVHDMVLVHETE